jgi:flagellar basal-body rod protein FlgB
MVSIVNSNTTALVSLALDAANMRQQAIAQNIANANTPGYQRISVSFEDRMAELRGAMAQGQTPSLADLSNYRPALQVDENSSDGAVALDMEVAKLSEVTVHQQALLKALTKHYALLGLAINEGKR